MSDLVWKTAKVLVPPDVKVTLNVEAEHVAHIVLDGVTLGSRPQVIGILEYVNPVIKITRLQ